MGEQMEVMLSVADPSWREKTTTTLKPSTSKEVEENTVGRILSITTTETTRNLTTGTTRTTGITRNLTTGTTRSQPTETTRILTPIPTCTTTPTTPTSTPTSTPTTTLELSATMEL